MSKIKPSLIQDVIVYDVIKWKKYLPYVVINGGSAEYYLKMKIHLRIARSSQN